MFKTTWKSYFKNNEKNTWKFTKKPGKIMEFCQYEKVGTLSLFLSAALLDVFDAMCKQYQSYFLSKLSTVQKFY